MLVADILSCYDESVSQLLLGKFGYPLNAYTVKFSFKQKECV